MSSGGGSDAAHGSYDGPEKLAALKLLVAASEIDVDAVFSEDDECLKRFLRARKGHEDAALKMLLENQAWRKAECPWWPRRAIPLDLIKSDILSGKAWVAGRAGNGGPVTWVLPRLHDKNEDRTQLSRFVAFLNDEAVSRLDRAPDRVSKFSVVLDMQGFGYSAGFDPQAGIEIVKQLSAHFPERLHKLIITREPMVFWALWKIVSVFLDPHTKHKIVFCGVDKVAAELGVAQKELPRHLGGENDALTYDPKAVLATPSCYTSIRDGPMAHLPRPAKSALWEEKKEGAGATA